MPRHSQNKMLRDWFKRGKSITPLRALNTMGIYRLAARVNELRNQGMNIVSEMQYVGPVKFARYKLLKS